MMGRYKKLKAEHAKLQDKFEDLKEENDNLEWQIYDIECDISDLKDRNEDLEQACAELEENELKYSLPDLLFYLKLDNLSSKKLENFLYYYYRKIKAPKRIIGE